MRSSTPPPPEHKVWAKLLRERAGESARVVTYADESEERTIAVFSGRLGDCWLGATVGLMNTDQSRNASAHIPTEILMERRGTDEHLGNVLSTIAFYSIRDGWRIAPDTVFEQMVSMYLPQTSLPHVMFVPIFRWSDMSRVEVGTKLIYPLLAIPISQAESDLVTRAGAATLTARLQAASADVSDWTRGSVA